MMAAAPVGADRIAADVYLQPHSDDICFSLGALADARHGGRLLTVFPVAGYLARQPGAETPPVQQVTAIRLAEDQAFADHCGLETHTVDLAGASVLGHPSFDLGWVEENAARTRAPLIEALRALAPAPPLRPWLFCPGGIGDHVDHVAVLKVIVGHYDALKESYRIAFYEDLYYASDPFRRRAGLERLHQELRGRALMRHAFAVSGRVARKRELIALYRSQFVQVPATIVEFTPASGQPPAPHEAVWTEETEAP